MRPHGGFTLAEVLVALFVVAVGIAGAAGLHARALRAGREAAYLSDGVQLASALAERMRANPAAMALPDDANPYLQADAGAGIDADVDAPACHAGTGCDPSALARFDLAETARLLAAAVPGGRLLVCRDGAEHGADGWSCDGAAGAPLVVKLGWRSEGATAAPRVLLPVGVLP
jgi:type IV pilus assembly protein PilV